MLLLSISHERNREISVSALTLIPALVIRLPQDKAYLGVLSFALPPASLISLNLTYSIAIRLLLAQTVTSLTLAPGSRSAASVVGRVIFY